MISKVRLPHSRKSLYGNNFTHACIEEFWCFSMAGRFLSKPNVLIFLLSAAIRWLLPLLVFNTVVRHWFSNPEAVSAMILWPALLLLATGAMTKGKVSKWSCFFSIVAGVFVASIIETSVYTRDYPMPPELYLRIYVSSVLFPATAAGLGIAIGVWLMGRASKA